MADSTEKEPDLLRLVTLGSVDDGKSTLIGRLLLDSHVLPADQVATIRALAGTKSLRSLAADFNVSHETIRTALRKEALTSERVPKGDASKY